MNGTANLLGSAAGATPYGAMANVVSGAMNKAASLTDMSATKFGAIDFTGLGASDINMGQATQGTNQPWWVGGWGGGGPSQASLSLGTAGAGGLGGMSMTTILLLGGVAVAAFFFLRRR